MARLAVATLLVTSIFALALPTQQVFSSPIIGPIILPLSSDNVSFAPQVAVSGNYVYVVWLDVNGDIQFVVSSDGGDNFDPPVNLNSNSGLAASPQVVALGNNVYIAWIEGFLPSEVAIMGSIDNGATFNPSNGGSPNFVVATGGSGSSAFQLAASDNNVYVLLKDIATGNISFAKSADNADTFDTPVDLSTSGNTNGPTMAASGDNVYVAWQDIDGAIDASGDILFTNSTDDGATFNGGTSGFPGAPTNLSNTPGEVSANPQLAASDSNVYATWQDTTGGDLEILFRASDNNALFFEATTPLSTNTGSSQEPQITASDDNVYVVWQDNIISSSSNEEVLFRAITDSGTTFVPPLASPPTNISNNAGLSLSPKISAFDNDVHIAWQDKTMESNGDILFRSSTNNGATFGGLHNISENPESSFANQIDSSSTNVSVVWNNDIDTTLPPPDQADVFYRNADPSSSIDVAFNAAQYGLDETVTITVNDPSFDPNPGGADSINAAISSAPSGGSIASFLLTENGDSTGIFTGQLTFTSGASTSTTLHAEPGDVITASYGGQSAIASIIPIVIKFLPDPTTQYARAAIGHLEVTDVTANLNPASAESISVQITSTADTTGSTLTLTETGPNTGVFGTISSNKIIFMTENNLLPTSGTATVTQTHEGQNIDSFAIESISETVTSTTNPGGITITLTETDIDTGDFTGVFELTTVSSATAIQVAPGDIVSVFRTGFADAGSNGLVIPKAPSDVAILVTDDSLGDDIVSASYRGVTQTVEIIQGFDSGGGGGGLSRAGFVVNVVAGISTLGGGGGGNSPPSFGQSSFAIISGGTEGFGGIISDNEASTLEEAKTFKVGEKAVLRFDFTEGGGIGKIEHIGLYANVRDGQKRQDSDAFIYYDPLKSPQVTVHDANGLFSEVNFELLQMDATKFVLKYELTFAKPMAKSDLILESWNIKKWSSINKISNAIEVLSSGILQEAKSQPVETFLEDVTDDTIIPVWVKSNAKWWSENKIDNDNFISGLEYLVNEGIIKVSLPDTTDNTSISEVQPWIKSTAGWWADGMITEDEFITAIEWLITNNIIEVAA